MKALLPSVLGLSLAACSSGNVAIDDGANTNDELRSGGITSLDVHYVPGFGPTPPNGSCRPDGHWSADLTAKHLSGEACIDGVERNVDRDLSDAELARVKSAANGLKTTARPQSCPSDVSSTSIDITRGRSTTHYADANVSCRQNDLTPLTSESIRALLDVLRELTSPGDDDNNNGDQILGDLDPPGAQLNGRTFTIARGSSLVFTTTENQIRCVRDITAAPESAITVKEEVVRPREDGLLGGSTMRKRTLTVSRDAAQGSTVKIKSTSCFQVRDDAGWNLDFKIKVK